MKQTNLIFGMILLWGFLVVSCGTKNQPLGFQREASFHTGWKFLKADPVDAQTEDFDDSGWRELILPHDWSIEDLPEKEGIVQIGPFSEESEGGAATGHVVGGVGWYRKHFTLDKTSRGKQISILFDGVYMDADVWMNGHPLGNHPYGYTAFSYNLSSYLNPPGEDNVLAVRVNNEGKNSRWYSGSGIYRNVTLITTNPVAVALWGNFITTPQVSKERALVRAETRVIHSLYDPEGKLTGKTQKTILLDSNDMMVSHEVEVTDPALWCPASPALYTAVLDILKEGELADRVKTQFGIRSLEFSPEKGFLLNGEKILLKGGCLHHDNGPLGAAAFKTAEYRRVQTMKENGFNAIRTAHNPPSEWFLNACDELGMLVMDESFDHWQRPKNPQDYHRFFDEWWEKDMKSMVLRDRNHPSIIIWSIGNEINERADSSGLEIARRLKEKVYQLDGTRPVTQAICEFWDHPGKHWEETAPAFAQMDIHGYNYQWARYEEDLEKYPDRMIVGTESVAQQAFENWQQVEKFPNVIGDFVWTGMDYLGESGIGNSRLDDVEWGFLPPWPWYNAFCGDISILGYKKPQMVYRDVVWQNSQLEILVHAPVPEGRKEIVSFWGWPDERKSWNWKGNEGKTLQVNVYTRAQKVRLELNGQVIGEKKVSEETKLTASFEVPYQPGELKAVAWVNGEEIARQVLKTTGPPAAIQITPEKNRIKADPECLAYFNVKVVDEEGMLVPDADIPIDFEIEGGYILQAVANGNPQDMKSFQQPSVHAFRGKCQLIVRSAEKPGLMKVTAHSEGVETGEAVVRVQ
jgi:beta-galactosidase